MTLTAPSTTDRRPGRMYVARSRGAVSGFLLVVLGLWGALAPFIGPYFHYGFTPDTPWAWTWGRFWLEILPGVAAILGGLMLMGTSHRAVGVFAGYLAGAAGAWFVLGQALDPLWPGPAAAAGTPVGDTTQQLLEQIGMFAGLGVVILFLAAQAVGRFTVLGVRDVHAAERRRTAGGDGAPATRFEGNRAHDTRTFPSPMAYPPPGAPRGTPSDATTRIDTVRRP